jgi:hypothetical protein
MLWKLRGVSQPTVWLHELDKVPEGVFDHIDTYLAVQLDCGAGDVRAAGIMPLPAGESGYRILTNDKQRSTDQVYTWEQVKQAIVWELRE